MNMRVLFFNEFTSQKGGVDIVVNDQIKALTKSGIQTKLFRYNNSDFLSENFFNKLIIYSKSVYGSFQIKEIQELINDFQPDIIHIHNTYQIYRFPFWNYLDIGSAKIVLQLHNFYPFCLNSFFFRKDENCQLCYLRNSWLPGILHKCYNNSFLLSFLFSLNRPKPQNWNAHNSKVSCILTVSEFMKETLLNLNLPKEKVKVLSNFITLSEHKHSFPNGKYILYLGNIISAKGINIVCEVAKLLPEINFIIAGNGIEFNFYKKKYQIVRNINFIGYVNIEQKANIISNSRFIFFPTLLMETFGLIILEAFSLGKPVFSTGRGAVSELIKDGWNGRIFNEINIDKLAEKISIFWSELINNYDYFEHCIETAKKYSADVQLKNLLMIYDNLFD